MATQTPNLNLVLPDYADKADIGVVNDNFKKIDSFSGGGKVDEWLEGIKQQADESLNKITQDASTYLNRIQTEASESLKDIQSEATESLNEIENKAANALASIPDDYETLSKDVSQLKDTKAGAITDTSARAVFHELHAQGAPLSLKVYGKSSGVEVANVHVGGANLFSSGWEQGQIYYLDGSNRDSATTVRTKDFIPVQPGFSYHMWRSVSTGIASVRCYNANKEFVSTSEPLLRINAGVTAQRLPIPAGVYYIRINEASNDLNTEWMLVFGSIAPTSYEPYNAHAATLELLPDGEPLYEGESVENWVLVDGERKSRVTRRRNDTTEIYYGVPVELRKPKTLTADTLTVVGSGEIEVGYQHQTKHYIDSKEIQYKSYGLPVLELYGSIIGMSQDNAVTLEFVYGDRTGTCTCKWQGSSSLAYPKKNYTIKFDEAFEAKEGWGAQKKYCFKANWIDASHSRNIVSAGRWGAVVKARSDVVENLVALPNGGAIDGFPCIITINGEFQGLYTWNIPKDGWMYGMGSGTQEAIVCADAHVDATRFKAEATLNGDFELEYVSDEDNAGWVLTSLNRLINAVMTASSLDDLNTTVAQYLDWDSAIDYFIFTALLRGDDMFSHNYLLYTYDGVKWHFGAYDMDGTWGLHWTGQSLLPASTGVTFEYLARTHRVVELIMTYRPVGLKTRYNNLRLGALSEDNVAISFGNFIGSIPTEVYSADRIKWPGVPSTSVNDLHQITDWYRRRVARLDAEIAAL